MALLNDRQALMHLARIAARHLRCRAGDAHFVDPEEDPCTDHVVVDPLDDRDRRCAVPR